jgi:hypothetical protein
VRTPHVLLMQEGLSPHHTHIHVLKLMLPLLLLLLPLLLLLQQVCARRMCC